jgi:hypothetical protein
MQPSLVSVKTILWIGAIKDLDDERLMKTGGAALIR